MGAGEDQGTKEFDASQHKLNKLRRQGSVPKSQEVNQLLSFIVAFSILLASSGLIWEKLASMFHGLWGAIYLKTLDEIGPGLIIKNSFEVFIVLIVPLLLASSLASIFGDILQVGLMVVPLKLRFEKLNPVTYFKQTFKVQKIVELLKQIAKVCVLVGVAYFVVHKHWLEILTLTKSTSILVVGHVLKDVITDFVVYVTAAMIIITLIDSSYQRFQFMQEQRMTRKEMMDEYKETEGDPYMKQKRKALARSMIQRKQMDLVPEADFITTNPYKIAVAVKYHSGAMKAPQVLAKGSDAFAWRIIELAKTHQIPVIENIPLARALYKLVQVGDLIPPQLYRAVAEVLLFVYQVRGKARAQNRSEHSSTPAGAAR